MKPTAILKITQLAPGRGSVHTSYHALPWRSLAFELPHFANWLDLQDLDSATQLALSANAEPPYGLGAAPLNWQEHTAAASDHGLSGPHANITISVNRPGSAEIEIETRSQDGTHWTTTATAEIAGDDTREPHAIAARHIEEAIEDLETDESPDDPDVRFDLDHHYAQLQDQEGRAKSITSKARSRREADLLAAATEALPLIQAIADGALLTRADAHKAAAAAARVTTHAIDLTDLIPVYAD